MWTLTHAVESKKEVEEVISLLTILSRSFAKQDPALLKDVGGVRGFKDRMAALLNSKDDVVAGFAATMLGIMGVAAEYAGEIARVLQDEFRGETVETAAYALAKLGFKQHTKEIMRLLGKEFRKGDAAKALAVMGAAEYADEIARMLGDKNPLNRWPPP
jgi:HEAT repeat protein